MLTPRLRLACVALTASLGLTGCVGMNPYGYNGVSVGYGSGYGYGDPYGGYGYDPYGYGYGAGYGYGSRYGSGYGYGYGMPYYGWYDDFYYPGTGYYVYTRDGSRRRWSEDQRRFWEKRKANREVKGANWSTYRNPATSSPTQVYRAPRQDSDRVRVSRDNYWQNRRDSARSTSSARQEARNDRREAREERRVLRRAKRD